MRANNKPKSKRYQSQAVDCYRFEEDQFDDGMEREVPAMNRQGLKTELWTRIINVN